MGIMNGRTRFVQSLLFRTTDRIPLVPGAGRRSTLHNWHRQGLPEDVQDIAEHAYREAGGTLDWPREGEGFPTNERMIPQFEEKVLERKRDSQIVQDWKGNICEISNDYSLEHLRSAIDFVTRRWIRCPVTTGDDWRDMKRRYDPGDPARFPPDAAARAERLKSRTWIIELTLPGPFWQLREWVGFERLCTLFYDDRSLVVEMIEFWRDYVGEFLRRAFTFIVPDIVHISEDMAFKGHSMLSPEMVRTHLLPTYREWGKFVHDTGCPVYDVDSDGYVGELIPLWLEGGFDVCDPVEVAAGNDIVALRERFGTMAYRGGVDKRAIARGGPAIRAEIERITPVIEGGGFIPGCDHGVPPDITWQNFVLYVGLLARATGWL